MIDSSDKFRLGVLRDELDIILDYPAIKSNNAPFLFYANKMDLKEAITPADLVDILKLSEINNRSWNIWFFKKIVLNNLQNLLVHQML